MSRTPSNVSDARRVRDEWPVSYLVVAAMLVAGSLFGNAVQAAVTLATVRGTVTNSYTDAGVAAAKVTFTSLTWSRTVTTDSTGAYIARVPANASYDVSFEATNYNPYSVTGSFVRPIVNTLDAVLTPVARVIVEADIASGTPAPGGTVFVTASYTIMDGSTVIGLSTGWTQTDGLEAVITKPFAKTTSVKLPSATDYAAHLIQVLKEPPITEADLPPDLVLQPINEINKGLQDRNQVVAINPFALEKAEELPLHYTVTTTSGAYGADVNLAAELPWVVNTGLKTVPVAVPVLLYAKDAVGYDWSIVSGPNGYLAALTDAATQTPWFTPDKVGTYQVQEANSGTVIDVHVGHYHGVIDPILTLDSLMFGDGLPVADENCTSCHTEGGAAPDMFTPWRTTGHAEAFTQGITTNGHFGENCFACHAVGFDRDDAGGIDDTPNYTDFLNLLAANQADGDIAGTWETMLMQMPDTARMSNIQCENCHGPQDYTQAHKDQPGAPRVSLASDVCGSCHGEPARHGRFEQWQLSNHADYDLARARGASGGSVSNCSRCHSGNGFVAWNEANFDPAQLVTVTWNQDTVVPQTCAACHNPHDTGSTSGSDETNAKVRIMPNTHLLLAGFTADNVGKGATCMTCHNSRASFYDSNNNNQLVFLLRNDSTWPQVVAAGQATGRPHHGVQADLLMGQNMYFFDPKELYPQARGKHSLIEDTCVTCHMNKTQPPDILSYNQTGTNHTFAADPNVCADCHGDSDPNADTIDTIVTGYMNQLQDELGAAYQRMMEAHYPLAIGSTCGDADGTTVTVSNVLWDERATRLDITLSNGNFCDNRDPASITVDSGEPGAQSLFALSLATNDGAVLKAAWNWSMLNEDETIIGCVDENDPTCTPPHTHRGVHNPDFCTKGLTRAIAAVQEVGP